MSEGWVFWKRPLRVSGPCAPEVALARLRALLAPSTRFSSEERLVGRIDGPRVRVWKRTLLSGSSDVVQFEGVVHPDGAGCAIDGTLGYNAATRLQFIGFLAAGLLIAGAGLLQKMAGSATANDVILFGSVTALLTVAWIGASSHMKEKQVEFVEAKLRAIVDARD